MKKNAKNRKHKSGQHLARFRDALRVQYSMTYQMPKGRKATRELLEAIFRRWVETGKLPRGFKIATVIWQNPTRKHRLDRRWRTNPESDFDTAAKLAHTRNLDVRNTDWNGVRKTLRGSLLSTRMARASLRSN